MVVLFQRSYHDHHTVQHDVNMADAEEGVGHAGLSVTVMGYVLVD